jgi:hypothetical protein
MTYDRLTGLPVVEVEKRLHKGDDVVCARRLVCQGFIQKVANETDPMKERTKNLFVPRD